MTGVEGMRKPSSGSGWLAWGIVLLVLGVIGIVIFFVGSTIPSTGDEQGSSVWQSLSVILGAIFFGVGLASVIIGSLKRRKFGKD
jgi:protein-S-isoprenylcysteine O-methyltransferase Ste14